MVNKGFSYSGNSAFLVNKCQYSVFRRRIGNSKNALGLMVLYARGRLSLCSKVEIVGGAEAL